jgi:hypothetical protein|tara:strand:+ start:169 stop:351 length:183 start_codon:yes stop_codon:yes gene_type:complete
MGQCKLCKTKQTYKQPGGLDAVVLDTLETYPNLRIVAVKREWVGWTITVINKEDLEYLDE